MRFMIIFIATFVFASYSIQVISGRYINTSLEVFRKLSNYPCVRIEYIDGFYVVRVGISDNKEELIPILNRIKNLYKDSFILEVKFNKKRIVISKNCNRSIFKILKSKFTFKSLKVKPSVKKRKIKIPDYIEYSIANLMNDRYKLKELLNKNIASKDKVEGYIKVGEIGKAYNQIFNNLNNSLDFTSYKQAIDFMSYLNYLSLSSYYETSKDYKKVGSIVQFKKNNLIITLLNENYFDVVNYPSFYLYEADFRYKSFLLNINKNYSSFFGVSFFKEKSFDRLKLFYQLSINKKANESVYLLRNGKKNSFTLKSLYNINNQELVANFNYSYFLYRGAFIGDGEDISFKYKNYLRLGYPNINYYFLFSNYFYNQKHFDKKILPEKSSIFGFGFNIGDRDLNFNNRLLPFFKFFINYDLVKNILGYESYVGLKGRLFRKDYFFFGFNYYRQLYNLYKIILSYKYYF